MDTSKQYIEMCKAAQEIQSAHTLQSDKLYEKRIFNESSIVKNKIAFRVNALGTLNLYWDGCLVDALHKTNYKDLWFEILNDENRAKPSAWCQEFYHNWLSVDVRPKFQFTSLEQLSLAFVMYYCYNKIWINESKECKEK